MGALLGLVAGIGAGRVADALPSRYGVELLVEGAARTRRNVVLALLGIAIGAWLAHYITGVTDASPALALVFFSTNLVLSAGLLAAAAIDLEHMILPNEVTLGGAVLALGTAHWRGIGLMGAVVGTAVGVGVTYVPAWIYKRLRGRSGMGLGDAKLALLAGAWLGAPGAIFVVFAGALQSALCGVVMRVFRLTFAVPASVQAELADLRARADAGDEEARALLADDPMAVDVGGVADAPLGELATMRLPMGPFLVLSCLEFVVARHAIVALFDRYVAPP